MDERVLKALKRRRLELNLTVEEVAAYLYVSPRELYYYEQGKRNLSGDSLLRLLQLYDLQLDTLNFVDEQGNDNK